MDPASNIDDSVTIVGAGIAGAACAVALAGAGIPVRVVDRGRDPGGRMASPALHGRPVDLGAAYFTVRDRGFAAVVDGWAAAGLARPWTDTFGVLSPGQPAGTAAGPTRWSAPGGLQTLVAALLGGIEVQGGSTIEALPGGHAVLAMPDPLAARLVAVPAPVRYDPAIAVACELARRDWPFAEAAFVNGHPDVEFVADDGSRRGDGAPVLVAHTTAALARRHLRDAGGAVLPVVAALGQLMGIGAPLWAHAHAWSFAKPAGRHRATFATVRLGDGRQVGLAGDQWCPDGSPRVESAWRSGTDLGAALAASLRH